MKPLKARNRYSYPREFKIEAVRLVQAGKKPVSQIARELDVPRQLLYNWVRQAESEQTPGDAFRGNGNRTSAESELERLKRENAQLKEDNEILKKATAFFAKESPVKVSVY